MSGACSAFRRSVIYKTQMYHTETVGEDTQITFQIRQNLKRKVYLCKNAYFFVDPIENLNKLYTQRQRWQQGEIEVSHLFYHKGLNGQNKFSKFLIRILCYDHTFVFPRMIWYFALLCLAYMRHPLFELIGSVLIMYGLYVVATFLNFIDINLYMSDHKSLQKYYRRKWYLVFVSPLFNMVTFWIRFAGIINSFKGDRSWKTSTFSEECTRLFSVMKSDFSVLSQLFRAIDDRPLQNGQAGKAS